MNNVERFDEVRDKPDLSRCIHDVAGFAAAAIAALGRPDASDALDALDALSAFTAFDDASAEAASGAASAPADGDTGSVSADFFLKNLNIGVRRWCAAGKKTSRYNRALPAHFRPKRPLF